MLDIHEHTIRLWDTKLTGLSRQSEKGKNRFFSQIQINKLSYINKLLKNNDSLSLANEIASRTKLTKNIPNNSIFKELDVDVNENNLKVSKIKSIIKNLKYLINS